MELLLAQPVARSRLILAHLCVDLLTIPILCLSLWAGNWAGALLIGRTITPEEVPLKERPPGPNIVVEVGPLRVRLEQPPRTAREPSEHDRRRMEERLRVEPERFGPALWLVGGLVFAVCGYTMWLSSAGRFRWRVLGVAVFVTLVQFLVNLVGQMWPVLEPLRPLTVFYYYQPQQVILGGGWDVTLREWNGGAPLGRVPMPAVLYGVGLAGYSLALWTLRRRDLPAPL
jgi:ABC-2 type transport system permease protein